MQKKPWKNLYPTGWNKSSGIYSISNELRKQKKIDEEFELKLARLSLEELIGLRLELAARSTGNKYFGFKLYSSMTDITRNAVVLYAYSCLKSKLSSRAFLGITWEKWKEVFVRYAPINYFLDSILENREILSGKKKTKEEKEREKECMRYNALIREKVEWIKRNKRKKSQTT